MATGLGKSWLAAFDSTRPEFGRVLFAAHREEILNQCRDAYRRIRPDGTLAAALRREGGYSASTPNGIDPPKFGKKMVISGRGLADT